MLERPVPVDRREVRQDVERGQQPGDERPEEDCACDERVEERLDDERRTERRVRRAVDAPLHEVQPEQVAASRGEDRVHADSGEVRAGDAAPRHARALVRGDEDVAPGGDADDEPQQVEEKADPERRPADGREMLEERADGVDDLAHARWTLDSRPWWSANTSTFALEISSTGWPR